MQRQTSYSVLLNIVPLLTFPYFAMKEQCNLNIIEGTPSPSPPNSGTMQQEEGIIKDLRGQKLTMRIAFMILRINVGWKNDDRWEFHKQEAQEK